MSSHHVAIGSDRNYIRHAGAAALSAIEADPSTTVHLLHAEDVGPPDLERFQSMAEQAGGRAVLHRIEDDRLRDLAVMDRIGTVMWFRILLPELLPDVGRVLYLDADTLVVDSVRLLFEMPLGTAGLAAAHNVLEPRHRDRVTGLGLDGLTGYFNSGVLVLDLDQLRADGRMGEVLEVARARRDQLVWPDQDALNLVFADDRVPLHPRWNTQNSLFLWRQWADEVFAPEEVDGALQDPAIIHFEGPGLKPWFRECPHPRVDAYRRLAARTPWGPIDLQWAGPPPGLRGRARRLKRRVVRALPRSGRSGSD